MLKQPKNKSKKLTPTHAGSKKTATQKTKKVHSKLGQNGRHVRKISTKAAHSTQSTTTPLTSTITPMNSVHGINGKRSLSTQQAPKEMNDEFSPPTDSLDNDQNPTTANSTKPSRRPVKQSHFNEPHVNPTYITNPIFYVNGQPHIGHLYTSLLSETIRNWKRSLGNDTFVMGGTDEHGIKVQEASEKAGYSSPLEFCDKISQDFENAWEHFALSPDAFLRTTSQEHEKSVQWMWKQLARNGYIYLGKHAGWYCKSDEVFVPLNQLIEHKDDKSGESFFKTQSGHDVIWLEEENFKFKLSKFLQPLLDYYEKVPSTIFPHSQLNQVLNQTEGLEDISISRLASKLQWSSDVPDGDDVIYWDETTQKYKKSSEITTEKHKVYVWLDALNIYITGARHAAGLIRKGKDFEHTDDGQQQQSTHNKNTQHNQGSGDLTVNDLDQYLEAMETSGLNRIITDIKKIEKLKESQANTLKTHSTTQSTHDPTTTIDSTDPTITTTNTPTIRPQPNARGLKSIKLAHTAPFTQHTTITHPDSFYNVQNWFANNPHQQSNQHIADAYQSLMAPVWPPSMHVVGKDIVKFHAIYWPSFLIGCGLPIPQQIVSHSHWLVNGQKMSKSLGNVVSPQQLESTLGIENTKYALMRLGMIGDDSDFILDHAIVTINAELSDTLGNLAMRCTGKAVLPNSKYPDPLRKYRLVTKSSSQSDAHDVTEGNTTTAATTKRDVASLDLDQALKDGIIGQEEMELAQHLNALQDQFNSQMEHLRVDRALMAVAEAGRAANGYFSLFEPWKMAKNLKSEDVSDEEKIKIQKKLDIVLYFSIEAVRMTSLMLRIVTPNSADVILDQLSFPAEGRHLAPQMTLGWHPTVGKPNNENEEDSAHCFVSNVPFNKIKLEKEQQQPKKPQTTAKKNKESKKNNKKATPDTPDEGANTPTTTEQKM